jgi:2-polyprenyl-3-methyl-5-hydroxy-6-metoxy-1,4-benzoquinol methylase
MNSQIGEKQYASSIERIQDEGNESLGLMTSWAWQDDPKHLFFTLSRYKFVAKMLSGKKNVLEVGCSDAFASRIVRQEVKALTAIDFDQRFINDAQKRTSKKWPIALKCHDILLGPVSGSFDGAYSLDVLEHIPKEDEQLFLTNITDSLTKTGVLILGMPSLNSQVYASQQSIEGHVNCKQQESLKELMGNFFNHVFMFSMNDEVVHTGFHAMAHYHIALCCGKK